jgi:hypothetical protein
MNRKTLLFIVAVLASAALSARAQNLVMNPGFETGDFTNWTLSGDTSFCSVSTIMPHSGNFAARLGPSGSDGFLDQTITTVVGQAYAVDFWLAVDSFTPNDFSASFAGNTFYSVVNDAGHPYIDISATITATSTSSLLHFAFFDPPAYWNLDDITVVAVPEPGTVGLIALGALGLVGVVRKRRSV